LTDLQPASNDPQYIQAIQTQPGWLRILESFARFVSPAQGARVVDLGSGPGVLVDIFQRDYQANAFGIDSQPDMLLHAPNHDGNLLVGNAYDLPLASEIVDCVTATNVLYLLDSPQQALAEITRVLRVGGRFAMLNPSPKMTIDSANVLAESRGLDEIGRTHLVSWATIAENHPRWSLDEIIILLQSVGLTNVQHRERIGDGLAIYVLAIRTS
jgi:ubiquinone/menaquinone biosynthesis C-methylase UbiE